MLVNIRKFTGLPLRSLDELVQREMLDRSAAEFLRACVRARLSIVFAGTTRLGQDHPSVLLRGRARPRTSGGDRRRGL